MKYLVDFRGYNDFPPTLKLSMQFFVLQLRSDTLILTSDETKLPVSVELKRTSTIDEDRLLVTTNELSDAKNKALVIFDNVDYSFINNFDTFICFHEKIKKNLTKLGKKILDIPINYMNISFSSNQNVIFIAEKEEDIVFVINVINSFYKKSQIMFYVVSNSSVNIENINIIEPNLDKILKIENSILVNLSSQTGYSTLINIWLENSRSVASIEHQNVRNLFADNFLYFSANIKSIYMLIEFMLKKKTDTFINLIIQAYEIKDAKRKEEIEAAILHNINNKFVTSITCLMEKPDISFSKSIMESSKMKFINVGKWVTYADIFNYANTHLNNQYVGVLNIDIGLDYNSQWTNIKKVIDLKNVIALSKHEYKDNKVFLDPAFSDLLYSHTQDGWFFKAPLNIKECDFEIGLLGCDNAIAHRIRASGYSILNLMNTYKLLHFDNVRGKNGNNFLEHQEEIKKIINTNPEKKGYRLLPGYETVKEMSFDAILNKFNVGEIDRYNIICDILSTIIKIKN